MKKLFALCLAVVLCLASVAIAETDLPSVVIIPKLLGIAYFNDSYIGVEAGAKDFGINAIWDGPTEASATEQAKMIEDYLAQGVDAILICPNDASALETTIEGQGRRQGRHELGQRL